MALPQVKPVPLLLAASGAGLTVFLLSKYAQGATPTHDIPDEYLDQVQVGWHGDPVEVPKIQQPKFPNTTSGHIAFVATMLDTLGRKGLTPESSILFTAHVARETGWGKAIWNNNIGNIKTGSRLKGPYFWMTDARKERDRYRSYDTLDDGLEDDLALIRDLPRYQDAWAMLQNGDPNWYGQLGLDGYYEGPANHSVHTPITIIPVQKEYNSIVTTARRFAAQGGGVATPTGLVPGGLSPSGILGPIAPIPAQSLGTGVWIVGGLALLAGGIAVQQYLKSSPSPRTA